jgi:hypothetical protein
LRSRRNCTRISSGFTLQAGDWITNHAVGLLSAGLAARSNGTAGAAGRAVGLVAGNVRLQAYSLPFIDAFHLIAWVSVATLILIATLRRFPLNFRDLAALDAGPAGAYERPVMTLRASTFALLLYASTGAAFAQQPDTQAARRLTLREAVDLALAHNHAVRLAHLSVDEKDRAKDVDEERLLSPGAQRHGQWFI